MATEKVLHMNGGMGETSYANNSQLQRKVLMKVKPILEENITRVYKNMRLDCLKVADLGCSSGSNTFYTASEIIDIVEAASFSLKLRPPEFQVFLNDLAGNDFNTIFKSLPDFHKKIQEGKGDDFGPCFIVGVPGSFYGRLFPCNSIHFFHSSYSLHWLSQVPKGLTSREGVALNKENIYIANTSPLAVWKAYLEQFQEDFKVFLRHRSVELMQGCGMVLTFIGRLENEESITTLSLIGMSLHDMVLENKVEEAKLESFDIPYYAPTEKEVREIIEAEGSLTLEKLEICRMGWDADINESHGMRAKFIAKYMRAITEPLLKMHFGEAIMDELFLRFTNGLVQVMQVKQLVYTNLVISMTKN